MTLLKKLMPKTLKSKLRIALFVIGFFPYLFILIYSHNLGEKKILDDAIVTYHSQMNQVRDRIEEQLLSLEKEMRFLASLDMMNDMIVGDVDKRITQLLIQKQKDLALKMHLFTLTLDHKVIASSDENLQHNFIDIDAFHEAIKQKKDYFFTDKNIVMFTPIRSTLDKDQLLGYLFMEYSFSNLSMFTVHDKGIRSMLFNPEDTIKIGNVYEDELLYLSVHRSDYVSDKYLILYEEFEGVLSQWTIVYMIQKSVALAFLDEFILFVWGLFVFGFIVIAIISFWFSKRILEPISKLNNATKSIISTKDYTTQVSIASQGEISELANDFNAMIREINHAFNILEEENKLRLLRFVQLINIFNRLIQTQTEESCIALAIDELQTLMPHQYFSFSSEYPDLEEKTPMTQYMMLYVKDFDKQTSDFYGVISFTQTNQKTDPHEEKFYRSIATMIMLQLDQIRLIAQTQAVSHAKSTFISHMSHELRTPLHTILSSTQYLISYENLTADQQEIIATMESSADHLLGMINDILDLVQIEAGKVTITPVRKTSDEIEMLTQEVITMLDVLAEQKDVKITLTNAMTKPLEVIIDYRFLKQILINLLSNAVKFTDEGSIDFILKMCDESLCIVIQDSGIGIDHDDLTLLFDDFTQAKRKSENHQKGSGLGLAISRKLAHLFNADIILESEGIGQGTRAIVKLRVSS
ncbi:ATP-binding protein [Sulfurovum sp.]|uniref:sensor histidine kinase n=1 Tax=Sulfurovum sp. TaxID=1969726 RepID=UPI0035696C09